MYISKIRIKNFRNFREKEVLFNDGINVIIGHNNSGKTNLIKALSLAIDTQTTKRLEIDDFNKHIPLDELKSNPPKISIAVHISQSENEDLHSDDLVTVGNWLIKLVNPYEALLTYEFFLPEKEQANYVNAITDLNDCDLIWKVIKHDFIRLYTTKIFGGDSKLQMTADTESLQKFDFQFLDAIRDVERDMFSGKNTLLRDVLDFFMDYEIKSAPETDKTKEHKEQEIKAKKRSFNESANTILDELQRRMKRGKEQILSYAKATGASFKNTIPDFQGEISDVELFSALKLIIEHEIDESRKISIPATHNGLGYNNLLFMSLLLAKMQVSADGGYLGNNAKVFPILAIEEPEAHLHPAMQYKFLKFLKENRNEKKRVRQVFIITHSTQLTSAVSLDEIICLHNENGETMVGYPGKVFSTEQNKSKKYVQRFLDATRSDMLFAQKVILVEGIAEQLLLSTLAQYEDKSLEDEHIAVINVGGRFFDHFLYLFDTTKSSFAIPKKVICITDRDPVRRERPRDDDSDEKSFEKCYPFEYKYDQGKYEYENHASNYIDNYKDATNIRFFSQDEESGKTFEYDLITSNPKLKLLITDSISNKKELQDLMDLYGSDTCEPLLERLKKNAENSRIKDGIINSQWSPIEKQKAIIAARYLNSVGKGENALELVYNLTENLLKNKDERADFQTPGYIREAIQWICS
ncbi:ATP-dependent nuclease [Xanthocytophaga flava]|uniref:ATP-dependent nuclease n=1 Tax=Xanthocytophaga flava TaxID=3048013 RepID=UPI0028D8D0F2|nr:AAA family ATPase [Xanthocytophaga flavus]MDJ1473800.1 AAA family ATPase [Xanthocytophaga flavus]